MALQEDRLIAEGLAKIVGGVDSPPCDSRFTDCSLELLRISDFLEGMTEAAKSEQLWWGTVAEYLEKCTMDLHAKLEDIEHELRCLLK